MNVYNSPENSSISSPNTASPAQPDLDVLDTGETVNNTTKDDEERPVMDLDNIYPDPLIVVPNELNQFKSPVPILPSPMVPSPNIQSPVNLLNPSPIIQPQLISSLLTDTSPQQTIQFPIVSSFFGNNPLQQAIPLPILPTPIQPNALSNFSNVLDTYSQQSSTVSSANSLELPFQNSTDSFFLPIPIIQNPSSTTPFSIPVNSMSTLPSESMNNINIMKLMNNSLIQNNESAPVSISSLVNDYDGSFPPIRIINQCMVDKYKFKFTSENISELVRLAPVEFIQEDVFEIERLSRKKRKKGRPRKPRKYCICPFIECQKKFNREYNLKEHIKTHNPKRNKDFVCHLCDEEFFSLPVLSRHIASIHQGEEFSCKDCGKKFNRKDALQRHRKVSCHM